MTLWVMSRNESAESTAIALNTLGLRDARFQAPNPPDEKPKTPRLRRFAVHALAQADRIATACGQRRYSLFTGDLGTAPFAAACLDVNARFPVIHVMTARVSVAG